MIQLRVVPHGTKIVGSEDQFPCLTFLDCAGRERGATLSTEITCSLTSIKAMLMVFMAAKVT